MIQEIFGVNHHIKSVTDRFAKEGYLSIAPALFDRVERGFESGYQQADKFRDGSTGAGGSAKVAQRATAPTSSTTNGFMNFLLFALLILVVP